MQKGSKYKKNRERVFGKCAVSSDPVVSVTAAGGWLSKAYNVNEIKRFQKGNKNMRMGKISDDFLDMKRLFETIM